MELHPGDPPAIGPYRLLKRLGEGGQGVVYLGQAPGGQPVAVKVLLDGVASDGSFAKEVAAARRVEPFCIAQVLDASLGGRPYIVTEYVEGPSLQQAGRHAGADLQRLAVSTATALTAIHRAGVVHRDFKPANVLLGRDGPRVIDFGIARATGAALTVTSSIVGTPSYMAPEQLLGAGIGPATDVFAWAAVIVFAATGSPPFGNDSLPAVLRRIQYGEPELGGVAEPLRSIVYACLAKDPAHRPTMQDVLFQLIGGRTPAPGMQPGARATPTGQPGPQQGARHTGEAGPWHGATPTGEAGLWHGMTPTGEAGPPHGATPTGEARPWHGTTPAGGAGSRRGGTAAGETGPGRGAGPAGDTGAGRRQMAPGSVGSDRRMPPGGVESDRRMAPGGAGAGHRQTAPGAVGAGRWKLPAFVAGGAAIAVTSVVVLTWAIVSPGSSTALATPTSTLLSSPGSSGATTQPEPTRDKASAQPSTKKPTPSTVKTTATTKPTVKPTATKATTEPTTKPTASGSVRSISLRYEGIRVGDCWRSDMNIWAKVSASGSFSYRWLVNGENQGRKVGKPSAEVLLASPTWKGAGQYRVVLEVITPASFRKSVTVNLCGPWEGW